MSKILFIILVLLAVLLLILSGIHTNWYVYLIRYILLLSSIIPISLRVNLDLAKAWYSYLISSDNQIPDSIVRNTLIPEDLGRIQMLLSDKTGTLTKNEMELKSFSVEGSRFEKAGLEKIQEIIARKSAESSGPLSWDPNVKTRRILKENKVIVFILI